MLNHSSEPKLFLLYIDYNKRRIRSVNVTARIEAWTTSGFVSSLEGLEQSVEIRTINVSQHWQSEGI